MSASTGEAYLAARDLRPRPAFETAAPAMGLAILQRSDALWVISRGVVAEGIAQGLPAEWPTGTGAMTGSVGITRRQSDAPDAGQDLPVALIHRHA